MARLTKTAIRDRLRAARIFNDHHLAGSGGVYVVYRNASSVMGQSWQVVRVDYSTDPDAPWYNNGHKTFDAFGGGRAGALVDAQAWAAARYGIDEWERSPFGNAWHPAGTVERRLAEIEQAAAG